MQSICQYLIYSYPKPNRFRESLPQFRDVIRLRVTCRAINEDLDKCHLLFALATWLCDQELINFDKLLNLMSKSNWKFYWLHFDLCEKSQIELIPFVRYENLFSRSLRIVKITDWHVNDSFSFRFLDKIISPCYASLCNERTKIDIEMVVSEQKYQIPALNSANMVSSLNIMSTTSISGIQQLSSAFRENFFC